MYIYNRCNNSKFNGCIPLQNCNALISLKPKSAFTTIDKDEASATYHTCNR